MKAAVVFSCLTFIFCLSFSSCKKADVPDPEKGRPPAWRHISEKVALWLDTQKSPEKKGVVRQVPGRNGNIDLLKENLAFGEARMEEIDAKVRFLHIPVKDALREKKNLDRNATLSLVLSIDAAGEIYAGGIIYFLPQDGRKHATFPPNIFKNMFSGQPVALDGMYKMLSVTGKTISQVGIVNGRMAASGIVQKGKGEGQAVRSTNGCIDWYMVTTHHYPDGSTSVTEEYLYTTCSGCGGWGYETEECLEPDDGGSGGGGVNDDLILETSVDVTGLRSTPDPDGGTALVPVAYRANTRVYYSENTRIITGFVPQKPYPVPPSQYFVDSRGNLAHASVSVDNGWAFKKMILPGGRQALVAYTFITRWYYTYSTTTIGPRTFNDELSEFVGPF